MFHKLYRDPAADPATATPAPAAEAPASPAPIVTPSAYGGSGAHQLWEDPYNDSAIQSSLKPQPPAASGGNKTGAPAFEGGIPGQGQPAATAPASSASSTAPGDGQPPGELPKGAWSDQDLTYWNGKDPAFKDMPYSPQAEKMSKQYRELEGTYNRSQQYLTAVNQTIEDYKTILGSGDPAEIAKMVEHFGGQVQFDTRKPEDMIKEAEGSYDAVLKVFQALQAEFPPEAIPVINRALAAIQGHSQQRIDKISRDQELKSEIQKIAKANGLSPQIGNPHERYKAPAQANMTQLEREANDQNFWNWYQTLSPEFKPGGMFHAMGLTAGKAFGSSVESARYFMDLARGRWISQNLDKEILPAFEKTVMAKLNGNKAAGAPPQGGTPAPAAPKKDQITEQLERQNQEYMDRRRTL